MLSNPNSRFPSGVGFARGRQGLGFNRSTWNKGAAIGKQLKRAYDYVKGGKSKRQSKTDRRRSKAVQTATPQLIANNGESKSRYTLKKPLSSKVGKLTKEFTPSVTFNNYASRFEIAEGVQDAVQLFDLFTDVDVNAMFTLSSSTPASCKIFLRNVHAEAMIKNQCDSTARIKIYDVMAKMTTDATTINALGAFSLGFADLTSGAAADYTTPGITPFTNPRFKEFMTILNTTDVILCPGATHSHVVHYAPNRLLSHIQSNTIAGTGISGLTVYSMMVVMGSPINAVSTQTEVSTSPISLDIVGMEEYKYSYVYPTGGAASIVNSLDLALSSAGATMQADGVELAYNDA